MLRLRAALAIIFAGIWAIGIAPASALASSSGWSIQPSPVPAGATDSVLSGVSCAAEGICMAVGDQGNLVHPATLAEFYDGHRWVILRTPNATGSQNVLLGVSCPRVTSCIAVGFTEVPHTGAVPLALGFHDRRWVVQPTPSPPPGASGSFSAVSCPGVDSCTAVGSYVPAGVDSTSQPLAEHWNGSKWTIQPTPNPQAENGSLLDGVSCVAPSACMAVADYFYADIAESIYALQWRGSTWTALQQPNPRGQDDNAENAVSCADIILCAAVGSWVDFDEDQLTLAEDWNGTTWTQETTPNPAGSTAASLNGVSCPIGSLTCTAVGGWSGAGSSGGTLAEAWNGSIWSLQATPDPSGAVFSSLTGVDCLFDGPCVAVGNYYDGTITRPLVEAYSP